MTKIHEPLSMMLYLLSIIHQHLQTLKTTCTVNTSF